VGAAVGTVVFGAVVTAVVTGAVVTVVAGAVVMVVTGAVVTMVVSVGTGVGVTGAGFWVVHPANSTLAVIRTAKIRKILFLSMTEFSNP
jgi:hypothetical protein